MRAQSYTDGFVGHRALACAIIYQAIADIEEADALIKKYQTGVSILENQKRDLLDGFLSSPGAKGVFEMLDLPYETIMAHLKEEYG